MTAGGMFRVQVKTGKHCNSGLERGPDSRGKSPSDAHARSASFVYDRIFFLDDHVKEADI